MEENELYAHYHNENKEELKDALLLFKKKSYQKEVVDLCIDATLETINANQHIFQKEDGQIHVIDKSPQNQTSRMKDLYLLYHHTPNTNHLGDYYIYCTTLKKV